MGTSPDIEQLLAEIDEATAEIGKVKDKIRRSRIAEQGKIDVGLQAALSYWEECKQDAENRLRLASR